jgi:hypothetical protein
MIPFLGSIILALAVDIVGARRPGLRQKPLPHVGPDRDALTFITPYLIAGGVPHGLAVALAELAQGPPLSPLMTDQQRAMLTRHLRQRTGDDQVLVEAGRLGAGSWRVRHSDLWVIEAEGWREQCLEDGLGRWSVSKHGEEAEWTPTYVDDRIEAYREEAGVRRSELEGTCDLDAPPRGGIPWIEFWVPADRRFDRPEDAFEAVSLTLWELPDKDRAAVTDGDLPFFRGGAGPLHSGLAYFISSEMMAGFYGPVTEYRLRLRRPKFVSQSEWGGFDSIMLRFDPTPVENLRAEGFDSAVWATDTPKGRMYTVLALDGRAVSSS